MAGVDVISTTLNDVSMHLEAIRMLGSLLGGVEDRGGTKVFQYDFCVVFQLLAEAAQVKLEQAHTGVQNHVEHLGVSACSEGGLHDA